MSRCAPNHDGEHCEWPICGEFGKVNAVTRQCDCASHFAQPFCDHCEPGFWGRRCNLSTQTAVDERSLHLLPRVYIIVSFGIVLILLIVTLPMAIRALRSWKRRLRNRRLPPPYSLVDQVPPPRYRAEQEKHKATISSMTANPV